MAKVYHHMNGRNTVSGVVLAGGMGRRVLGQDKGLLEFNHRPLVTYALDAMAPLVDDLLISANRNLDRYREFGYPVITDASGDFYGPLAGILAAMRAAKHTVLLVMPCDSPFITTPHLLRLLAALSDGFDIALADDGKRLHPVFAALHTRLQEDLDAYLRRGERRLQGWMLSQHTINVDFSDTPEIFANINTPEMLALMENGYRQFG